jgi:4-amino-4-deoxy-L-arabinose transferase-like glycosyltransferase
MNSKSLIYIFFTGFIVVYLYLHLDLLGEDLNGMHLWRQTETQTNIQNFYRHDYNILNPSCNIFNGNKGNIKRFEFPIMQWLIANFYFIFGDKIIITRAMMFFLGAIGILGFLKLLWILTKNTITTIAGTFVFSFAPLYYFYVINPMPDVFAFVCSIWYVYFFIYYLETNKYYALLLSGALISLSILAKLPFVIYGVAPAFYVLSKLFNNVKNIRDSQTLNIISVFSVSLIPPIIWYSWVIPTWGTETVVGGILNGGFNFEKYINILKYHYNVS